MEVIEWIRLILMLPIAFLFLLGGIGKHFDKYREKIRFYEMDLNDYEKLYAKLRTLCDSLLELKCTISEKHIIIGDDNLPKAIGSSDWGYPFTVYTSAHGKVLHAKYGCSNATIRCHIFNIKPTGNIPNRFCSRCWHESPKNLISFLELSERYEETLQWESYNFEKLTNRHVECNCIPKWVRKYTEMQGKINANNMRYSHFCAQRQILYLDAQEAYWRNYLGFKDVECYYVTFSDYPPQKRAGREFKFPAIVRPLPHASASQEQAYRIFRIGFDTGGCRIFNKDTDIIFPGRECMLVDSGERACYIFLSQNSRKLS